MLLAGNPLTKIEAFLFVFYFNTWANRSLMESKTQYLKISLRNRVYHLHISSISSI